MKNELAFREIQIGAYGILKQIASICDAHDLRYFLTYGSLIGAVRHNGIIPWDDDIDLMMPRPDYEKLRKLFIKDAQMLLPLKLFDPAVTRNYPHMIIRISDMRYHLIFNNEKDYDIGLFVDIYPLDGVGNDIEAANKLVKKTKSIASLCFLTSRKKFAVDNTESKWKMLLKAPAFVWAKLRGNKYYIEKLAQYAESYCYEDSQYVACVVWPAGKKYGRFRDVYRKEVFNLEKHQFEDGEFNIPVGYDEFLTATYGDYMIPPDEKGRKTHHTYRVYKRQ